MLDSKKMEVYKPGEPVDKLAKRLGIPVDSIIKLNANENLFLPKPVLQRILTEAALETDPRLYPGGEEIVLCDKLAKLHDISPKQIILAAGGDMIIDLLMSSLVKSGDTVLAVTPTFSMYPRTSAIKDLRYRAVPLDNKFRLDGETVLDELEDARLIVLCNPNNPTSNQFCRKEVMKIIEGFSGFILIDEAYAEFGKYSLINETLERENLIILRTFSKAYGLAGLRLGYGITNLALAQNLVEKYKMPFSVPNYVLRVGEKILDETETVQKYIGEVKREREFLEKGLNNIDGVKAFPSDTNFILFSTNQPFQEVYSRLLERGIIIRKIGSVIDHSNCLRVTVAPREISSSFLDALQEVMA